MLKHLPNQLTVARIALIPFILALILIRSEWAAWMALSLFFVAAFTDWLDGYLARKQSLESSFGRVMDVMADKLLVASLILVLSNTGDISGITIIPAIIILMREVAVSGLREFLAGVKISMPVSKLAKWKTTSQFVALGFLIIGDFGPEVVPSNMIGTILLWISGILTSITAYEYMRANWQHISEEG